MLPVNGRDLNLLGGRRIRSHLHSSGTPFHREEAFGMQLYLELFVAFANFI